MFTSATFARNAVVAAGAALIASSCLAVAATPASAAQTVHVSRTVSYADLNLSNPRGRAVLNARIVAAARQVCAADSDTLTARAAESRCIRHAVDAAIAS